ncbi:MAG TPA: YihY/virulence factor BrkB family protein [Mycobacteriales bacterium]|nr:YihY/virulence factor BrkB family protein [Mycobacteriales bacterium]
MDLSARVDRFQQRHPAVGYPLAVIYKFFDDQGNYLTAMITYYAFLSLFPLLLLLLSILGFALHNDQALQDRVVDSAVSRLPVIGTQIADNVQSLRGNTLAVVIGALGGLYGSLGVVQAAQNAFNKVWAVPRNSRPNPVMARVRSLSMLVVLGIGLVVSTGLSALSAVAGRVGDSDLDSGLRALLGLAAVVVNVALLVFAFRLLTAASAGTRRVLPGAIFAAVIWQVLQIFGTYYFGHTLRGSTATYGLFGIVLGLLVWLYLSAFAVVLGAEVNAVRDGRLWPRSLLTPFTDDVRLTHGDRKAYASYAETERHKGFETVEVGFDQDPPEDDPGRRRPH